MGSEMCIRDSVGSLWLTSILSRHSELSAFFQFDGDCKGRRPSNSSAPPRDSRSLFEEGCRCQSAAASGSATSQLEQKHKEEAFCRGTCSAKPSSATCRAVVAMADTHRARDIVSSLHNSHPQVRAERVADGPALNLTLRPPCCAAPSQGFAAHRLLGAAQPRQARHLIAQGRLLGSRPAKPRTCNGPEQHQQPYLPAR